MRRQREFVELLKTRQAKTEFAARLQLWLLEWDRGRAPEYDQLSADVYTKRLNFYVASWTSCSRASSAPTCSTACRSLPTTARRCRRGRPPTARLMTRRSRLYLRYF